MIRLQDIITEITLGSVTPYATQFAWQDNDMNGYETEIEVNGQRILFVFTLLQRREWGFGILTQTPDTRHAADLNWTVNHARSAAVGQVNYLRLMSTAAEAISDFLAQHQPEAVDVTGADTASAEKDQQKTRIYKALLAANATKLISLGYVTREIGGKLWIVRKQDAYATGIQ